MELPAAAACVQARLSGLHAVPSPVSRRHASARSSRQCRENSPVVNPHPNRTRLLQAAHQQRVEALQSACPAAQRLRLCGLAARAICRPWQMRDPTRPQQAPPVSHSSDWELVFQIAPGHPRRAVCKFRAMLRGAERLLFGYIQIGGRPAQSLSPNVSLALVCNTQSPS